MHTACLQLTVQETGWSTSVGIVSLERKWSTMKQHQVEMGRIYAVKIHRRIVPVQILYGIEAYKKHLRWVARNLETDEEIVIESSKKLKYEMVRDADGTLRRA